MYWCIATDWENYHAIISGSTSSILIIFGSLFGASVNKACGTKIFAIRPRGAEILVCEVVGIFVHITASSSGAEQSSAIQ